MRLKSGEPQLTMTSIDSLDDLAPFLAAICEDVTRQQAKSSVHLHHEERNDPVQAAADIVGALIERDFLEPVGKQ